jgi:AraC family ethanolamine operon transcriptional activator
LQMASQSIAGVACIYLRLKRLSREWGQLSTGAVSVKAAALTNGFWHLGDFSRVYTQVYGEMPSETCARAKAETNAPPASGSRCATRCRRGAGRRPVL